MAIKGWKRYWERRTPIEAMLLTNENVKEAAKWCGGKVDVVRRSYLPPQTFIVVPGISTPTHAYVGDYLVRENNGIFQPFEKESFEKLYESMSSLRWTNIPEEGDRDVVPKEDTRAES